MKWLLGILLILALPGQTYAYAYAYAGTTNKADVAREIFDRLVAARGDTRLPAPTFVFSQTRRSAARCEGSIVVLEEAAYDVCAALGTDAEAALAGILAHELIHYYSRHARGEADYALVGHAGAMTTGEAQTANETEADYLGGFLAHMAGYPTTNLMPRVLEGIYTAYELPEQLAGYPSLAERRALAGRTYARLESLIGVFRMGNALTALERYAEAAVYYDYLLRDFQSREVYNNTGVLYLKAALPLFRPTTLVYDLPVLLDLRSRLPTQTRDVAVDSTTRDFYLREAITNFQRAVLLDAEYAPALVNLASAYVLLGQSLLEGNPNAATREIANDRFLAAGIRSREAIRIAIHRGQEATVADARNVLQLLTGLESGTPVPEKYSETTESIRPATFTMAERLGGATIADIYHDLPGQLIETVIATGSERMSLANDGDMAPYVSILRHRITGGKDLVVARTEPGYPGRTALEIGLGDAEQAVAREYGAPAYRIKSVGGELLVYPASQLVFSLREGVVLGWWLYM